MKPELRQWLIEKINDTGLLSGRVYSIQTTNNVVEPFALISEIDEKVRRDSMDTFLDLRISVSVFASDLSLAEEINETIKIKLQVTGETENYWILAVRLISGKTKRNRLNYQVINEYVINIQEK